MADIDILRSSVINARGSQTIIEKTPFWPVTWFEGEFVKVRFNAGYIIDYQNQTGRKIVGGSMQATVRPANMDATFTVSATANKFYLKILTESNSAAISRVDIFQTGGSPISSPKWHFGSVDVAEIGYEDDGSPAFLIPMAKINPDTGFIEEICLRENVHYQQFHMANVGTGSRVLKTIGDSNESYGTNPDTEYRSIVGVSPIKVTEEDDEIKIEYTGSTDSGKTAIVPFRNEFVSFWCAEAPTPYFFEVFDVNIHKRKCLEVPIDDELVMSCEKNSLKIWSVEVDDPRVFLKTEIFSSALRDVTMLKIKTLNFLRRANSARIIIGGTRKGFDHKYKRVSRETYRANKRFYNLAHNPDFMGIFNKRHVGE